MGWWEECTATSWSIEEFLTRVSPGSHGNIHQHPPHRTLFAMTPPSTFPTLSAALFTKEHSLAAFLAGKQSPWLDSSFVFLCLFSQKTFRICTFVLGICAQYAYIWHMGVLGTRRSALTMLLVPQPPEQPNTSLDSLRMEGWGGYMARWRRRLNTKDQILAPSAPLSR